MAIGACCAKLKLGFKAEMDRLSETAGCVRACAEEVEVLCFLFSDILIHLYSLTTSKLLNGAEAHAD